MNTSELLDALLSLFRENVAGVDFCRAWDGAPGSRRPLQAVVTGEVEGETLKPESEEARYRFRIFLPEREGAGKAEEIFAAMCQVAGEHYPGFSAISRGSMERDKTTGLLTVSCTLSFLTLTGGGGDDGGGGGSQTPTLKKAVLGGREYRVSGIKTSISRKGQELISVGETEPFAVLGEKTEYTVELDGLDVTGLEKLAAFTASLGDGPDAVYRSCRWKSLSDTLRRGVFVSCDKR